MNKSICLVLILFAFSISLRAQTTSGNMMIGGSIDFFSSSSQTGDASDLSTISFSPSFGYFVSDNLAVGLNFSIASARTGTGSAKTTASSNGIGPFARFYKFTSSNNFAIYGEAGLSFGSAKIDPPFGNVTRANEITFSLAPGAAFFFNEHWALELELTGFVFKSTDPNTEQEDDKVTSINFGLGSLSPSIGLRYHF